MQTNENFEIRTNILLSISGFPGNNHFQNLRLHSKIDSCFYSTGWRILPFKYPNIPSSYWISRAFTGIHHSDHHICDCNANPSPLHVFPHGLLRHGPTYRNGYFIIVSTTSDIKDYSSYPVEYWNDCWFQQVLVFHWKIIISWTFNLILVTGASRKN